MADGLTPLIIQSGQGSIRQLPFHRNPGLEIVYVSKGYLRWEVEGRVENVDPESVFFTFPWEKHGSRDEYEPGHHWHWVLLRVLENTGGSKTKFSLHPALGFSKTENSQLCRTLVGAPHRSIRASREIAWILPQLVAECRRTDSLAKPIVQSLTRLLLLELVRLIQSEKPTGNCMPGVEIRMRACIRAIREQCTEPWTLERMSRESQLSRTRFSDMLKTITGDSPTIYHRRMRVRHAQVLLRTTDRPITEIAMESGFETSQHFARVFKWFTNRTASEYRKLYR